MNEERIYKAMIFVTVGTHEQQFNRLIKYIDDLKGKGFIEEEVILQTGFSEYEPDYCCWSKFFSYQEMETYIREAHIIITHGGSASVCTLLDNDIIPIVVPRQKRFKEQVNDHQLEFCRAIEERKWGIIPVYEIENLEDVLLNYDRISSQLRNEKTSNSVVFNEKFKKIVKSLF